MTKLAARSHQLELMDDPDIGYEEFRQTLEQLEFINRWTRAYAPTLSALEFFWNKRHRGKRGPLRILDIGCGYGDMLRQVAAWAQRRSLAVELTGVDLSPSAKRAAQQIESPVKIRYLTRDIFDLNPAQPYHVILNSLFLHHLRDPSIVKVLRWMTNQARYGWFANDLHRHWIPYHFIRYAARCGNRLISHDAPLSVARAFRRSDWQNLIRRARLDLKRVHVEWHWPFRWGVRYDAAS